MLDFRSTYDTANVTNTHFHKKMQLKSRMKRSIVFVTQEGHATVWGWRQAWGARWLRQAGRQADITNRAQMMMMMMMTGMSWTDVVSGSKYCNPYKPWRPALEINWFSLTRSWTKVLEVKSDLQKLAGFKNIEIFHKKETRDICSLFLTLKRAVWPRNSSSQCPLTWHFLQLSAESHSIPQRMKLLSFLSKCYFKVCETQKQATTKGYETFPPTLWAAPTEETHFIHDWHTLLFKHKADGESVRWGDK